ncbi:MAG: HAMP domain-containing histidine kinase [Candidatus Eisenbacteria bacterium]|uniref:histidine kinase n=1 Tax=Eiseniibacteriota bacterium TaxID=2212470 RepID=A0A7Y2E9T3_UNCEI|nr:HAMP domain-containing histidine kinase [Candidatus Eisenbacteria bacterium]
MSRLPGFPSLFWTFAISFLIVILVTGVLQILVPVLFLRPAVERSVRAEATTLAQASARNIGEAWTQDPNADIRNELRHQVKDTRVFFLLEDVDDRLQGFRAPTPWDRKGRPPMRKGRLGEGRRGSGGPSPGGPGAVPPLGADGRPDFETLRERFTEVARVPVMVEGTTVAELVGYAALSGRGWLPPEVRRSRGLVLPLVLLVSALGGLLLFRRFLSRLKRLENQAMLVSQGDLTARIPKPSRDEIGRVAESMNLMTENLESARAKIESHQKQRQQLIADISHELATPLTSIRGYAETLSNPEVQLNADEREQYLQYILHESGRMDGLIKDMLELSRVESGNLELDFEKLDLTSLLKHTVERFQPKFREAGLTLRFENGREGFVQADGRRLEQVFDNLLVNATRYVPSGGRVVVSLEDEGQNGWLVTIQDDGPGFPGQDLDQVFDRFYQGDASRGGEGSGLGLAIVQQIIRAHRGTVQAQNLSSGGASILISIPKAT